MAFDPDEFRKFAKWLVATKSDEASLRSAISRVYYAAHLAATRKLHEKGWFEPTGDGRDHRNVIGALQSRRTRDRAGELAQLLRLREHADYHLEFAESIFNRGCSLCRAAKAVDLELWNDAIEIADRFIPLVAKL